MSYLDNIKKAAELIKNSDSIVIGIGAGMSASGGLNYSDPELVKKWFPEYYDMGFKSLFEIMGKYWFIKNGTPEQFWSYWARHIWHIRYESEVTEPYLKLYEILKNKRYYMITTNCDSQINKAGFPESKLFAPQGNYQFFQCSVPCTNELFDNKTAIESMVSTMPNPFEIRTDQVPYCPNCGELLLPNLRIDDHFVEEPHLVHKKDYTDFLESSDNHLFIELGVGFNTVGIIRYPFDSMTDSSKKSTLIRINRDNAQILDKDKNISLKGDINTIIDELLSELSS